MSENATCAWCDQPILGTHQAVGGYLWHMDCRELAEMMDPPTQGEPHGSNA